MLQIVATTRVLVGMTMVAAVTPAEMRHLTIVCVLRIDLLPVIAHTVGVLVLVL